MDRLHPVAPGHGHLSRRATRSRRRRPRRRSGSATASDCVTDGPFAETKEVARRLLHHRVRRPRHGARGGRALPGRSVGSIEVRPIVDDAGPAGGPSRGGPARRGGMTRGGRRDARRRGVERTFREESGRRPRDPDPRPRRLRPRRGGRRRRVRRGARDLAARRRAGQPGSVDHDRGPQPGARPDPPGAPPGREARRRSSAIWPATEETRAPRDARAGSRTTACA